MNAKEAILKRRSVRKFLEKEVPTELIEELVSAGDSAPSACNKRPNNIYVITNKEKLAALSACGRFTGMSSPLAIVVAGDMSRTLPRGFCDYWIHDAAAATENILIMATALGLGACWCGVHLQKSVEDGVREALGLEESIIPFSLIRIGYPAEIPEPHSGYSAERVKFIG